MRLRRLAPAFLALGLLFVAVPARASVGLPDGWRLVAERVLADGVEHSAIAREGRPAELVNVARIDSSAPVALRPVVSGGDVGGGKEGLERTSAMCIRVRCVAAVNADFYNEADGQPIGGMVRLGELVRSPNAKHHQLTVDALGKLVAGTVAWSGRLVATDLSELALDGVNVDRAAGKLVLYTPSFGRTTGTNKHGVELIADVVRPAGALRLGQTAVVRLRAIRAGGNNAIPPGGIVLSGHGSGARTLLDLWRRVQDGKAGHEVLLRLESDPDAVESVGGTPILVHKGERWFSDEPRDFFNKRHPRTAVGWNAGGDIWLVTVDGRQAGTSEGMTMRELADFMISLAINLDGGGSTTFVVRGAVANRPSDRIVMRSGLQQIVRLPRPGERVLGNVERPVASALAVVPLGDGAHGGSVTTLPADLGKAQVVPLPARTSADPASNPGGALPALVGPGAAAPDKRLPIAAVSLVANLILGAAILARRLRPNER